MSRQGKNQSTSTPGSAAVPGAVAQQAQQYLEQNIMAWMQPKPQGQQILSSTLSSLLTCREAGGTSSSSASQHTSMSQKALQEHNMSQTHAGARHPVPINSPYQPIGGPYMSPSVSGASCMGVSSNSSIPHSLSFSGYSHHSLLQGTSFSSPCPSTYGAAQPSAAASFFARAAQRLNLSSKKRRRQHHAVDVEPPAFRTNFTEILRLSPPPAPPSLLRSVGRKENFSIGKVKVMLRISPSSQTTEGGSSFLNIDARKKQVSVYDPTTCGSTSNAEKRTGVSAPKMFAFDAIFSPDDTQAEVCSSSLPDVIQAVVGGNDGCLFVYGHSKLGKTHTIVGSSDSVQELGVIPCAISWLFRLIYEQRQKTGSRFSVRVSALEVSGRNEVLRDLLSEYATGTESSGTSPAVYLKDDPIFGTQLINQSELRAPTAEKAGYLLDAAVAARNTDGEDEGRNSHFLFALHLYQYRVEKGGKGGVAGGRSRLHLFDLGSCEKIPPKPRDGTAGGCLTLSAMGNVILALFNGQKHVPYKESKLTQLLREAMSSLTCRVAMIAHVSSQPTNYSEVLGTIQLASRVHRMRRRKLKYPMAVPMESSCDEKGVCVRPYVKMHAVNEDGVKSGSSDPDYTSSSEQSCDTVIYVGTGGVAINDRDLTDNEGPPASLPVLPKSNNRSPQNSKSAAVQKSQESPANISENRDRNSLSNSANKTATAGEESPKAIVKAASSNTELPSSSTTANDSTAPNKLNRDTKSQGTLKISHGSTQTPSTDPFSSHSKTSQPLQPQRKVNVKHRAAQQKQDGAQGSGQDKQSSSCKPAAGQKDGKPKSDEMWIDGPRFSKPKFDSRTLHQLQKEQWVDGPPVMYGFMDDHKQNMIRRWVEEHSHHAQEGGKRKKNEVWIDFPPGSKDGKSSTSAKIENSNIPGTPPPNISSESSNLLASKEEKVCNKDIFLKDDGHDLNRDCPSRKRSDRVVSSGKEEDENISETSQQDYEVEDEHDLLDDEADSASNSADVDETDNEENAEAIGYDTELHALHIGHSDITPQEFQAAMYKAQQAMLEYSQAGEDTEVEMIEVMEPDEPVPMVDSCLQVNEEDIIAECWLHANVKITENPLPEVDQGSYDAREHPLRILSEEDLNLPSSFTDSRSVSVDLDSVSVPDTCREGIRGRGDLTWRLLYGNMFQKIKEQHQQQRRTMEDINSTVKGTLLNEKLERIARLRELMQSNPSRRLEQIRSGASSPTCLTKGNTLLPRDSRLTLSEMLYGSKDSSMEDLSEVEINSTQSEPAELDIDKYDYKFNIKPMNGLKLEAFYNKIHKVPSFLEQFSGPKPTQVVPPLITSTQDKAFSQPQLDVGRSGSFVKDKHGKFTQGSSLTRAIKKKVNESASREKDDLKRTSSLKKTSLQSLRHPDGSSNPHLNKHPSMMQLQRDSSSVNSIQGSYSLPQRSPDGACTSDSENISLSSVRSVPKKSKNVPSELNEISKRSDQRTGISSLTYKNIDTSQLTVGPSPTHSSKSRQARTKGCAGEAAPVVYGEVQASQAFPSSSRSKETSVSSNHKTLQKSSIATRGSLRSSSGKYHPNNNSNSSGGCKSSRPNGANGCGKLPTRSSPTSSSTSGVTTTCCTSVKQKEKVITMKNKPPTTCTYPKQKQSILGDKRSQRTKSICRSTSSPSTCVDSGDTLLTDVTDSDHYHVTRHASVSGALASPYHKLPHVQVSHHHRTSSGHGSDSSVNSIEPREAKELLIKGAKTLQFSGTSSGYESMLRDSEGTPLSSSQESGTEGSVDREGRGRKGRRRSQGSSKRSLSAPARSPPSPTAPPSSTAVSQQPVANSRACQLRRTDRSLRRSEEEVCCTSLLCCRLLDFY